MKLFSALLRVSALCLFVSHAAFGQIPSREQQVRRLLDLKIQRDLFAERPAEVDPAAQAARTQQLAKLDQMFLQMERALKQPQDLPAPPATAPVTNHSLIASPGNIPPAYPPLARRNNLQGRVMLKLMVSADGRPQEVTVESSSGHPLLDEAALAAVKKWTFQPPQKDSTPADGWFRLPVSFVLAPAPGEAQPGPLVADANAPATQTPASTSWDAGCSPDLVPGAAPDLLRDVAVRCAHARAAFVPAVARLGTLSLPPVPAFAFQKPPAAGQAVSVRLEADVFFNVFDAYPPSIAFTKLAELVAAVNKTSGLTSVTLIAGTDSLESLLPWSDSLAEARSHLVHRYLLEAGMNPATPLALRVRRRPGGTDTALSRARDRVVEIRLTTTKAGSPYVASAQSYAAKVAAAIKSHISVADPIPGNPSAQVDVRLAPDGRIVNATLTESSGVQAWDAAVMKALQKVETLPLDAEGKAPERMVLHLRAY